MLFGMRPTSGIEGGPRGRSGGLVPVYQVFAQEGGTPNGTVAPGRNIFVGECRLDRPFPQGLSMINWDSRTWMWSWRFFSSMKFRTALSTGKPVFRPQV